MKNARISLLETIVQFSKDGIHAVNQDGKIIIYNEAQGKIDHYEPSEVIGRHAMDIYALDYESRTVSHRLSRFFIMERFSDQPRL